MNENKARFVTISFFILFCFLIIILRLISLSWAGTNKSQPTSEPKIALRGMIYDRNGVVVAGSMLHSSICANPSQLDINQDGIKIAQIALILDIDQAAFLKKIRDNINKSFIYIKRKVPNDIAQDITELKVKGIFIQNEYKRIYPYDHLASHLLGFAGLDDIGLEGLELAFDKTLKPKKSENESKIAYGHHLHLTIDYQFQKSTEEVLEKGVTDFGAEGGTIIVMDSSNGEILSLANYPNYNNNDFKSFPSQYFKNIAITDYYEPGSIFKMISAAICLEEGYVNPKEEFRCTGSIKINGREIKCTGVHGYQNLRGILKTSCNVGIVQATSRIPRKIFYQYLKRFGIGKKTDIPLKGESPGLLRPYKDLTPLSKAMMSFGYEIALTPLQVTTVSASLFNHGNLYQPLIVKKITDSSNNVIREYKPILRRKTISQETSVKLLSMLKGVVEQGGTGYNAFVKGLAIGGKTGTIRTFNREQGEYEQDQVNTSFVGYIQLPTKVLVIYILIRKPSEKKLSSYVTAPLFKQLVEKLQKKGLLYPYAKLY